MRPIAKRITMFFCLLALVITTMGGELFSAFAVKASAATTYEYTSVYDDLKGVLDPKSFGTVADASDPSYYSIQLLTIAEGEYGELFVYLYQPGGEYAEQRASHISICQDTHPDGDKKFQVYSLEYINNDLTLYKYRVISFNLKSSSTRYYEISNILRPWIEGVDQGAPEDNEISEKGFAVGKQFVFTTDSDGNVTSVMEDVDYIEITNKFVGFIRYKETYLPSFVGGAGGDDGIDSHFVAFSTDKKIDKLLDADIYYKQRDFDEQGSGFSHSGGWKSEVQTKYKYLDYEQKGVYTPSGFFAEDKIWDRIQKTSDFLKNNYDDTSKYWGLFSFPGFDADEDEDIKFTADAKAELSQTEHILFFEETPYVNYSDGGFSSGYYSYHNVFSRIGDVMILRLKFETAGVTYDLGVVDNMQTGSDSPVGIYIPELNALSNNFEKILSLVLLVALLAFIWPLITPLVFPVMMFLWSCIKTVFDLVFKLVTAPFRLLWRMIFRG